MNPFVIIGNRLSRVISRPFNEYEHQCAFLEVIDLEAVVGGNTVTNPCMVTEVYIKENGKWKMGSLTFFHLLRPVKIKNNNQ